MCKTIAVSNMKGGVGKTMTAVSLGAGLARQGKSVLCLDADAQNSLTVSFGISEPGKLPITLSTMMSNIINETDFDPATGIVHHSDGVDLLPSNNTLAGMEIALAGLIGRETVLRQYIDKVKPLYDYVIVDCAPSLDLLTINALAAADSVIILTLPRKPSRRPVRLGEQEYPEDTGSVKPRPRKAGGVNAKRLTSLNENHSPSRRATATMNGLLSICKAGASRSH